MARGVNKVTLLGNLGDDPKVTRKDNFIAAKISIATSESWKDKQGNKMEHTEWHRVVFFGKLAEIVEQYLKKGDKIYIEGKLRTTKYQDKDGIDRYSVEIIANEMQMLGSPGGGKERKETNLYGQNGQKEEGYAHTDQQYDSQGQFDDDIPF